ncbi:MAG TPA: AMP-binding protein, partial [Polyangia bacterium]|nr:AMP-binding protein [Polyangia bacterium]
LRDRAIAEARSSGLGRLLLTAVRETAEKMLFCGVVGGTRRSWGARLFGRQLRRKAGLDQVRDGLTGTAPIDPALHAWYEAIGLPFRVVYGQTELAGATAITSRLGATFGSVGLPLASVETKISDRGELLVRGGSLFTRYVGDAAATARTLEGAWLHTGDRAKRVASGELVLLGRIQALVRAAGGIVVDTATIAAKVRSLLGNADVVFQRAESEDGVYVYAALHPGTSDDGGAVAIQPVAGGDSRWEQMTRIVDQADRHGVVLAWALFEGRFGQATGEVGPTGKPRAWRIHELRSDSLRMRHSAGVPAAPRASTTGRRS